jgi:hypothetical protein
MYNRRIEKIEVYLFIILMALLFVFCSCGKRHDEPFKEETITTDVVITDVTVAKYTKVTGTINLNGCGVSVDNGNSGYYYKTYNLHANQIIQETLTIYYYPEHNGYSVVVGDLDVTKYETKK